jgi:hypothetical protein
MEGSTAVPNVKVAEMILQAPRLHPSTIDHALSDEDILALDEFENKWHHFLSSNPDVLPPGEKLKSCLELTSQLAEIEVSNQLVKMELQRQLDFFTNSKDQLEANFTKAMEEAALIQQEVIRNLNKEIDDIAIADQILSKTLPWEHFFDNLDTLTEWDNDFDGSATSASSTTYSRGLKPSRQAMYLANIDDPREVVEAALEGKSSGPLLRVFKVDNALLKAQVKTMQQEIDRLERTNKSQKDLAKFLSEYNIWGLLSKSNGGFHTVAGSTMSGRGDTTVHTKSVSKSDGAATTNPFSPNRVAFASHPSKF